MGLIRKKNKGFVRVNEFMQRKEIEKIYIKKINKLKKYDKAYFEHDSPLISDKRL